MLISDSFGSDGWLDRVMEFRHRLHASPCLSGEEAEAVALISDFLMPTEPDRVVQLVNGTGIAFVYEGSRPGSRFLLRADTDALPIQEVNVFEYKSRKHAVSHKCGHDGHTAMLAGIVPFLKKKEFPGEVVLLFQPAEEVGLGASSVIADPAFQSIVPDFVAGLHNLPGYPMGNILVREGAFAAASEGITIHLEGKTAHAAYPETGLSPALALAQLLTGFESMKNPVTDANEFHLVTVIYARLGSPAFGTAPGDAIVAATLRTYSNQGIDSLKNRLLSLAYEVAGRHGLKAGVSFSDPFRATMSNPEMVNAAIMAAKAAGCEVINVQEPFRWSEDFGQFTDRWPGVFVGLGAGQNHSALHNPDYDFPDELIPVGITFWENLVRQVLV